MDKVPRKVGQPPSKELDVAKKSKRRRNSESSDQSKDSSSLGIPSDISSDSLDSDDEIGVVDFAISSDEENAVEEVNEESAFVDIRNFEGHAETEGDAHEVYAQYRGYPQIKQFRLSSEEMALLIAKISEYRDLVLNRKSVLHRLYYEMRLGNILMKYRMLTGHYWEKKRNKNVLLRSYLGVRNVLLCMKDLMKLEEEYGYDLWAWKFLNCRAILFDIGFFWFPVAVALFSLKRIHELFSCNQQSKLESFS
ncbi:hypothetical protein M3Y94_01159600 [Aphelenchoides besseyi]|nr:hypothetical protein M3Y94_01159600 [Aphelenchoides besseyi]